MGGSEAMSAQETVAALIGRHRKTIQAQWLKELAAQTGTSAKARLSRQDVEKQATEFLDELTSAATSAGSSNISSPEWTNVRAFLDQLSRERAQSGFSSDETATFIFSLKRAVFAAVNSESGRSSQQIAQELWNATELLDTLGLHTVKAFQRSREELITRQQEEMLEMSTPVIKLWDGILAIPLIGTLDSARTQVVMESLLRKIVETESQIAIIDITGVPTVDTLVAQHLIKTVTALRLMGADCIVSGVRPQIAQTIVHLGVDLQNVTTKANLADALALALKRTGAALG
jgi:rsbT co-antagonist protein RsbR